MPPAVSETTSAVWDIRCLWSLVAGPHIADHLGMPNNSLEKLSRPECDALLRGASVGRVVYTDRVLPACTPVNYAVDGASIVFRTRPGSRLAAATNNEVVAFEVDDIDATSHSGWTVIVTGTAAPITSVSELLRAEKLSLTPWAAGDRQHWVRLTAAIVTGRRLRPLVSGTKASHDY